MTTQVCQMPADPVVRSASDGELKTIRRPDIALAVWQRPLPASLMAPLAELDAGTVDDLELTIDLPICANALTVNMVVSGYDEVTARLLAADIADLAHRFATIVGDTRMKIRLEVIETDACRRFHADYVTYRLLTTYRGQATQWIRAAQADAIEQLRAGDVAIFKGRRLVGEPPILHRSPPIAGSGEQRLLLVIDPQGPDQAFPLAPTHGPRAVG